MEYNDSNKMNFSLSRLIVMLIMLTVAIVGGTFAWFTFSSKQSALVLTIGDINDTQIKLSPYQIKGEMTPVNTYTSGVYSEVEVTNGNRTTSVVLYYKINDLDVELIDNGLAYTIINTTDNSTVKTGYFSDLIDTSETLPESVVILDQNTTVDSTTNYKVYLWLDSTKGNQNEVQGSSLDIELNGSIGSVTISGTNTYGQQLTANVVDTNTEATYTYQWFASDTNSTTGGTAISDVNTSNKYTIGSGLTGKYIYVVAKAIEDYYDDRTYTDVTDVDNNGSATVSSKAATLKVTPTSINLTYPSVDSNTLSYTYDGDGVVSCKTADSSVATCSVDTTNKKVIVTSVSGGTTTLTLTTSDEIDYDSTTSNNVTVNVDNGLMTCQVQINGEAVYGNELNLDVMTDPSDATLTYQWYTNEENSMEGGTSVGTSSTYSITSGGFKSTSTNGLYDGKYIYVKVTASKSGYSDAVCYDIIDKSNRSDCDANDCPVGRRKITVTAIDAEKDYDGASLTSNACSLTSGSFVFGNSISSCTMTSDSTRTNVGETPNKLESVRLSKANGYYDITFVNGTLTVSKKSLSLGDYNADYNGTTSYSRTFSTGIGSENLVLTYKPYLENVGNYTYSTSAGSGKYTVTMADGTGTASNYSIGSGGTFTINKKQLDVSKFTYSPLTKSYDGNTNAPSGFEVTATTSSGLISGDTVTIGFTGAVYNNANVTSATTIKASGMTLGGTDKDNYTLSATSYEKTGATITKIDLDGSVTITGNAVYGDTLTASVTNTDSASLKYQWYYNSSNSTEGGTPISNATSSTYKPTSVAYNKYVYVVVTATKDNYTEAEWFDITDATNNTTATVVKRKITITAGSNSKTYDGTVLTNDACTLTSGSMAFSQNLEGCTMTSASTITNVGSANNVIDSVSISSGASYYEITKVNGTLTVSKKSLSLGDYNADYNGSTSYSRTFSTGIGSENLVLTYKPYLENVGNYTYSTSAGSGKYTVTMADGTGTASNYSIGSGGTFTINSVNLTLTADANSGTISTTSGWTGTGTTATKTITYNSTYGTLPIPTRTGYTFNGWYDAASGGNKIESTTTVSKTTAHTIYAQWTANSYKIGYTLNGGTLGSSAPTTATYGIAVTISNPTKQVTVKGNVNDTGATVGSDTSGTQTFAGWTSTTINTSTAYYGSTAWTSTSTKVTATSFKNLTPTSGATVTLVANWEAVAFNLPTVKKDGHTCNWNTKADGSGTSYVSGGSYTPSTTSAATVTLYAQCTANSYTITYYLGNGTTTAGVTQLGTSTCTYNSSCTLTTWANLGGTFPESDNGWIFDGWSTSKDGTSASHTDGASFTYSSASNLDLYAVGSRTFKFYSGIAPTSMLSSDIQYWNPYSTDSSYLTSINVPSATSISGWTFVGYRASNTASSTATFKTTGSNTPAATSLTGFDFRTIYKRTLALSFNANGGSGTVSNVTATQYYNSGYASGGSNSGANVSTPTFTLPTNTESGNMFTRDGYSFSKWADGSTSGTQYAAGASYIGFSPAVDSTTVSKTMYAIWTANTYTITYYLGNGTSTPGATQLGTSTCTYDATCTLTTFDDLGGIFPHSSADNTTNGNANYYWAFYGWGVSNEDKSRNYSNGAEFTYTTVGNLDLYAIGRRYFYFNAGIAPTSRLASKAQYWNPYSNTSSYLSSITIVEPTEIDGWEFVGYKASNAASTASILYDTDDIGTTITPDYTDTSRTLRSVYKRTLTLTYNANGGSGTVSNTTATQYYNSGYGNSAGDTNTGARFSTPTFTLSTNTESGNMFTRDGYAFSKWADGSTSGDQYDAGASYTGFAPDVDDTTTTKTMYAIWKESIPPTYSFDGPDLLENLWPSKSPNSTNTMSISGGNMTTSGTDPFIVFNTSLYNVSKTVIRFNSALTANLAFQVFYASDGAGFSETNSVKQTIYSGSKYAIIDLPGGNYTAIRFDFGGTSGVTFDVASIDIVGTSHTNLYFVHQIINDAQSGLAGYAFNTSSSTPSSFTSISGAPSSYYYINTISGAGTYYVWGKDVAGNISSSSKTIYKIEYDACSGSGAPAAQLKAYGDPLVLSATIPTRSGYTFKGWATSASGGCSATSSTYNALETYSTNASTTLYAVWEESVINPISSYSCANGSAGSSSYDLAYTGDCTVIDDGEGNWRVKFLTSGDLTISTDTAIDAFLVGGGGGGIEGGTQQGGGGGGGYATTSKGINLVSGQNYTLTIGAGGAGGSTSYAPGVGGTTSIVGSNGLSLEASGGGRAGASSYGDGGSGGSGGGIGYYYKSGVTYLAGNGGSYGNDGEGVGKNAIPGTGQGGGTTCEFGEGTSSGCTKGDAYAYAGGGGGAGGGYGGAGGGGNGGSSSDPNGGNGTANTGGGGGGGGSNSVGGAGGSGIVVIRNKR